MSFNASINYDSIVFQCQYILKINYIQIQKNNVSLLSHCSIVCNN